MYRWSDISQYIFYDFNQLLDLYMDPASRWSRMVGRSLSNAFEFRYVELFESDTGNLGQLLWLVLGCLVI